MKLITTIILSATVLAVNAQNGEKLDTIFKDAANVDFEKYMEVAVEAQQHRNERLASFEDFMDMAQEPNTIILDTRSKEMYDRSHIKGALHLNFSDFNIWSLMNLVPDPSTRVLIYCNNNFEYTDLPITNITAMIDIAPKLEYVSKGAPPIVPILIDSIRIQPSSLDQGSIQSSEEIMDDAIETSESTEVYEIKEFPVTMALNIPTYINLYGYGYRNVYELKDLISVYSSEIEFEGSEHIVQSN